MYTQNNINPVQTGHFLFPATGLEKGRGGTHALFARSTIY